MKKLTCSGAKQFDLVTYLASIGHHPQKISNQDYWYRSPLREEQTPSFKVNRKLNLWYDHATGKGGNLIDFGTLYFKCSIKELLSRLSAYSPAADLSFHPPLSARPFAGEKKEDHAARIVITDARPLREKALLDYLAGRSIPLPLAGLFCKEIDFLLYHKKHTVIGFQNDAGGYELRSPGFKGSSSPKSITFLDNGAKELSVFEGFFNYLSFLSLNSNCHGNNPSNFLILNSVAFFQKSRGIMERHQTVGLYLDRDKTGMLCTQEATVWDKGKYLDQSNLYKGHKDINSWLVSQKAQQKESKIRQGIKR